MHIDVHITLYLYAPYSDVMSAILDSGVWVEAMRQCRGKNVERKMTPLRMMIERMPGNKYT